MHTFYKNIHIKIETRPRTAKEKAIKNAVKPFHPQPTSFFISGSKKIFISTLMTYSCNHSMANFLSWLSEMGNLNNYTEINLHQLTTVKDILSIPYRLKFLDLQDMKS